MSMGSAKLMLHTCTNLGMECKTGLDPFLGSSKTHEQKGTLTSDQQTTYRLP